MTSFWKLDIFRPHLMGKKIINCVVFFSQILPNFILLLPLVNSSHRAIAGSASAWQTRGCGFEPVPMRYIFRGKYPGG